MYLSMHLHLNNLINDKYESFLCYKYGNDGFLLDSACTKFAVFF